MAPQPQHTQGSCTPILVSPKVASVREPAVSMQAAQMPHNSPGSPTPVGSPRATRPALLGPRSHLPTLSTSLTLATQELPRLSGLICKTGQAPSPPQGTLRQALAAQRAFHWDGPGRFRAAWTDSVAEARERQGAGSHSPRRSRPGGRMGSSPGQPWAAGPGGLSFSADPVPILPRRQVPRGHGHLCHPPTKHPGRRHGGVGGKLTGPRGPRRPASWWILL